MSVLSDVYISDENSALSYDSDETKRSSFQRCEFKNLTPLEFSVLWTILEGREWNVTDLDEFINLLTADDGERQIHSFPAKFVAGLAGAEQTRLMMAADDWATTEELVSTPEDTRPIVEELAQRAREAINDQKGMYLWNCL